MTAGPPTQVRRPSRTTIRSVVQNLIAFAVLVPVLVELDVLPVDRVPWLAPVVVVSAVLTRTMADPRVEAFLRSQGWLAWLAADPDAGWDTRPNSRGGES